MMASSGEHSLCPRNPGVESNVHEGFSSSGTENRAVCNMNAGGHIVQAFPSSVIRATVPRASVEVGLETQPLVSKYFSINVYFAGVCMT